jgi:hypothetical protein
VREQNPKQVNFIPAEDVAGQLGLCDNKTNVINEALRRHFATGALRLDIVDRIQKLEEFERRFMAYYARTDGAPHSEFCRCDICGSNRTISAPLLIVALDPKPQTFEQVLSVLERARDQAQRMNATVVLETNGYEFRITGTSDPKEEYGQYMEEMNSRGDKGITVTMKNPWRVSIAEAIRSEAIKFGLAFNWIDYEAPSWNFRNHKWTVIKENGGLFLTCDGFTIQEGFNPNQASVAVDIIRAVKRQVEMKKPPNKS